MLNTLLRLYIQKQCLFNTLCVVGKILKQQTTFSMKEKEVCYVKVSQTVQYLYLYWLQIAESILYVTFKKCSELGLNFKILQKDHFCYLKLA